MGFKCSEIRIESGAPIAAVKCGHCDYRNGIPPGVAFHDGEELWCGGCGRILGTWSDAVDELYGPANRLLAATLAAKPKP